jgi:hypothetical protein
MLAGKKQNREPEALLVRRSSAFMMLTAGQSARGQLSTEGHTMSLTLIVVAVAMAGRADDAADTEQPSPAAGAAFEKHRKAGTLFDVAALKEFNQNGWKRDYAVLLRDRWKGQAVDGVSLSVSGLPNHVYHTGETFDCTASVTNEGKQPRTLDTGGSCGMTDALTLMVISLSDGQFHTVHGKNFGPHCFCRPQREIAQSGKTLKLTTGFASEKAVGWTPMAPGKYLVIGAYALGEPIKRTATVYSPPLVVTIKKQE